MQISGNIYLQGGVHFITSTILVMDLLYKRIPSHLVKGFIVDNCHRYRVLLINLLALELQKLVLNHSSSDYSERQIE